MAEDKFISKDNKDTDTSYTSDDNKTLDEQETQDTKEEMKHQSEEANIDTLQASDHSLVADHSSDEPVVFDPSTTVTTKEVRHDSRPEGENKTELEGNARTDAKDVLPKKKGKINLFQIIRMLCLIGFIVFTGLFINEVVIQPMRIKKSVELTRDLYKKPTPAPITNTTPTKAPLVAEVTKTPEAVTATPTPDPNRDEQGRLLQFKDLLAINDDVKGWITIPNTNIDYVVTQSSKEEPDYYLDKDINGDYSKAGTLYLDVRSSIEDNTSNLVIHGHNMVSTDEKMFHYLLDYKEVSYYKEHPLIHFDTIYDPSQWKIFAVFITNGSGKKEPLFDYRKSSFQNDSDFLNFIYQMRIRSVLNIDTVDINEDDQILTLSTCSYELDNYRTVIVARKVREGEDPTVDVESVTKNETPLYPESYYYRKGGKAPELATTFEEALENGEITWYLPPTN